ncbi:hypothetical protein [Parasitella parasitica]|uniref:Uncharacterized protein n=1 Tax=Parasitella parasitica TaxID=35722 RepID=A0A0B7NHC4_9FUNG|nr:hypothetical protein [Parasitella parasitica]
MDPPQHPGEPKWQSFKEWNTMKTPTSIQVVKSAQETREEQLARFGLTDEGGQGWGDASELDNGGWGNSTGGSGGGGWN